MSRTLQSLENRGGDHVSKEVILPSVNVFGANIEVSTGYLEAQRRNSTSLRVVRESP